MKLFFKLVGVLLLLVVIAVAALLVSFDPNHYKQEIEAQAQAATGRQLSIAGDIELSLLPIGIRLGKVELANAEGFDQPVFASIGSLVVKVQPLPLLQQQLQVDALSLEGLQLFLEINSTGRSNWQDLAGQQAVSDTAAGTTEETDIKADAAGKDEAVPPLAALAVNGLSVVAASIELDDRQNDSQLRIDNFNLSTGKITFDQAFDVALDTRVSQLRAGQEQAAHIDLATRLTIAQSLQQFTLDRLVLNIKARLPEVHKEVLELSLATDLTLDLASEQLSLEAADIAALYNKFTLDVDVANWSEQLAVNGKLVTQNINLRELAYRFAAELPPMQGEKTLAAFRLESDFSLVGDSFEAKPAITLDDSKLKGDVSVALGETPAVRFELAMDSIDVNRYLPPPAEPEAGPVATVAAAAEPDLPIPLELIRTLDVAGSFTLGKAQLLDYELTNIALRTSIRNGVAKLNPVTLDVLNGQVKLQAEMNANKASPIIKANLDARQLNIDTIANPIVAALITDQQVDVKGAGDITADVSTTGMKISSLQQNLNGKAGYAFKDIKADGLDIEYLARNTVADFLATKKIPVNPEWRGVYQPQSRTAFDVVKADFVIKQGVATTNNLTLDSKRIDVSGEGEINLPAQTLDMRTVTDLTPSEVKTTAQKVLDEPLPVRAHGPWAAPIIDVDTGPMGKLLEREAKAKVKKKVDEKVERKQDELRQKLDNKLQDKLKGLFR